MSDLSGNTTDLSGNTTDVSGNTTDLSGNTTDLSGNTISSPETVNNNNEHNDQNETNSVHSILSRNTIVNNSYDDNNANNSEVGTIEFHLNNQNNENNENKTQSIASTQPNELFNDSFGGYPMEFSMFKYEFLTSRRNNTHVLEESKDCKRLLDLKYNDLVNIVNRIQTSVIFTSTISGFIQATKTQFKLGEIVNSIVSITIATYISLILSISKYYGLDELKERIQLLREKYSLLLNEIDFNMDKLGPWSYRQQWIHCDGSEKYKNWKNNINDVNERYNNIIATKKELTSEYEDIMDTKSRNYYDIQNKRLNIHNKEIIYKWEKKENELERRIAIDKKNRQQEVELKKLDLKRNSIVLQTEEGDNWSFSGWTDTDEIV